MALTCSFFQVKLLPVKSDRACCPREARVFLCPSPSSRAGSSVSPTSRTGLWMASAPKAQPPTLSACCAYLALCIWYSCVSNPRAHHTHAGPSRGRHSCRSRRQETHRAGHISMCRLGARLLPTLLESTELCLLPAAPSATPGLCRFLARGVHSHYMYETMFMTLGPLIEGPRPPT